MLKIIDRYILRELAIAFPLSITLLISTLLMQQMLRLSRIAAETGISFLVLIRFAPFIIPLFLVMAIPLSMLISSTMTFSRLHTDHEFTAMRSAGISIYRMLLPVILFSFVAFLIALLSSTILQPMANRYIRLQSYEILKSQRNLGLEEGVFNNLFNLLVYVKRLKKNDTLEGVLISDRSTGESRIITAKEGRLLNDPASENLFLRLKDGRIYFEPQDRTSYQIATFSTYYLKIDTTKSIQNIRLFKEVWGMNLGELKKRLEVKKAEGNIRDFRRLMIEFHKKFSLPAVVLVLGILGVPVGIKSRFSRRFAGFILSIFIVLFYYVMDTGLEIIAVEGIINPIAAAWMPLVFFLLLAIFAVVKVSRWGTMRKISRYG